MFPMISSVAAALSRPIVVAAIVITVTLIQPAAYACVCSCPEVPTGRAERAAAVSDVLSEVDYALAGFVTEVKAQPDEDIEGVIVHWSKVVVLPTKIIKGEIKNKYEVWIRKFSDCDSDVFPGMYFEVLAEYHNGRLVARNDLCRCNDRLVFALDGPSPPWRAMVLVLLAMLIIVGSVVGLYIYWRHRQGRWHGK